MYPKPCGCKGCRTCLICEKEFNLNEKSFYTEFKNLTAYVYCPYCNLLQPGWDVDEVLQNHANHTNAGLAFSGILVQPDFITEVEESLLMHGIDDMKWDVSQSGRRKQNFGPKTNFKKQKLSPGQFRGFPEFSKLVQNKFKDLPLLANFKTIEQCSLEYDPTKGASIDPHIDDCWIWGERVVTVNCLTDSVLTLNLYSGDNSKYNLKCVDEYSSKLLAQFDDDLVKFRNVVVRVPMPRRSLIVMYGPPRYQWLHCVLREDIKERRVCIAYREFTTPYLPDGKNYAKGCPILDVAENFWNHNEVVDE